MGGFKLEGLGPTLSSINVITPQYINFITIIYYLVLLLLILLLLILFL